MRLLADFPQHPPRDSHAPPTWAARRLALRTANLGDLPFLRKLYGQTRAVELAAVPWPAAIREQFLDDQFAFQHTHYIKHFNDADFLVIEQGGESIGRFYIGHNGTDIHIVDISLIWEKQGQRLGSELIEQAQQQAAVAGSGLQLQVNVYNDGAQRLYSRLGFAVLSHGGNHIAMRWPGIQLNTA